MIRQLLLLAAVFTFVQVLTGCAARAVNNAASKGTAAAPHVEPVCVLKSPLPSSIPHTVVGEIDASRRWYGGVGTLIPLMADEARKMGADVVVNLRSGHKIGLFAWSTPYATGTGVKLANRADLNCAANGGELR